MVVFVLFLKFLVQTWIQLLVCSELFLCFSFLHGCCNLILKLILGFWVQAWIQVFAPGYVSNLNKTLSPL